MILIYNNYVTYKYLIIEFPSLSKISEYSCLSNF